MIRPNSCNCPNTFAYNTVDERGILWRKASNIMDTLVMSTSKTAKIEVRAEPEWVCWVHKAAKDKGLSASAYTRMVLTERMRADGIEPPSKPPRKPRSGGD